MAKLTLQQLIDANACEDQRELFKSLFGQEADVTPGLCADHANKFSWGWAASRFLSVPALKEYYRISWKARKEYDRTTAAAWEEYNRITTAAWEGYTRTTAAALREYTQASRKARKGYNRIAEQAQKKYARSTAKAFGRLYCEQNAA